MLESVAGCLFCGREGNVDLTVPQAQAAGQLPVRCRAMPAPDRSALIVKRCGAVALRPALRPHAYSPRPFGISASGPAWWRQRALGGVNTVTKQR